MLKIMGTFTPVIIDYMNLLRPDDLNSHDLNLNYKGYDYTFGISNRRLYYKLKYYDMKFHDIEDMKKYVDKILLREVKLKRLKMI